mmetsp:Transcript_88082/g.247635  ORF Transcript_88082/g.247635 Transcript_88082/m.247635 type:complete len:244 (+) Transcript_88082:202-933(+)
MHHLCASGLPREPDEGHPLHLQVAPLLLRQSDGLQRLVHLAAAPRCRHRFRAELGAIKFELFVDEGAALVAVAFAIVDVKAAASLRPIDDNCVRVQRHRTCAPPAAHLLHEYVSLAHVGRHMPSGQGDRKDLSTRDDWSLRIPEIEPVTAYRKIDVGLRHPRLVDCANEDRLAHEETRVLVPEGLLIVQVVVPQRPQDGRPSKRPLREECVPSRDHLVAHSDLLPYHVRNLVAEHPRLAALRL